MKKKKLNHCYKTDAIVLSGRIIVAILMIQFRLFNFIGVLFCKYISCSSFSSMLNYRLWFNISWKSNTKLNHYTPISPLYPKQNGKNPLPFLAVRVTTVLPIWTEMLLKSPLIGSGLLIWKRVPNLELLSSI